MIYTSVFFVSPEERIGEAAEYGVVSFISNSSYLTGRSHPLMRKSLLSNFHKVWIDNLNGDKYRTGKLIPEGLPGAGSSDQSAFSTDMDPRGIQPGTAISTWVKHKASKTAPTATKVLYRDFWGLAVKKRAQLVASLADGKGAANASVPQYIEIAPTAENRWRLGPSLVEGGFESWPSVEELFPTALQGVEPNRGLDGTVIDTDKAALSTRIRSYMGASGFDQPLRSILRLRTNTKDTTLRAYGMKFGKSDSTKGRLFPRLYFHLTNGGFIMRCQANGLIGVVPSWRQI